MKKYSIIVKGNHNTWSFSINGTEQYLDEWRQDGLVIDEIVNTVPGLVVKYLGYTGMKVWFFFQDIFYFKNPFSKN